MRLPEGTGAGLALTWVLILDTLKFFGMVNSCLCVHLRARVRTREMLIVRSKPCSSLALFQAVCKVLVVYCEAWRCAVAAKK